MAGGTRIRLNEAELARVNYTGGMVSTRVGILAEQIATAARVYAPKRTGRMVLSIDTEKGYARRTGCSFRVTVDVPYARYVLRGTYGPIHAKLRRDAFGRFSGAGVDSRGRRTENRKRMPVGRSQGGPETWAREVSGQTANDFLSEAARDVLARYGI